MAYNKTTWSDRQVQYPMQFTAAGAVAGTVTLTPNEGTIIQSGTPITAATLNNLETQYDKAMNDVNSLNNVITQLAPTPLNGWVDNSPGYPSYYAKDATGTVFVYLYLKNGSTALNVVVANLPTGYKPQTARTLRGYADGSGDIIYHISNAGEIKFLRAFSQPVGNFILLVDSYKAGS